MSEWKQGILDDIAYIIPGFAFKSQHFGTEGIPVIKITDINPPYINVREAMKVDLRHYDTSKLLKYKIHKDDFVIAMTGATIGKIGRLKENVEAIVNQRVAKIAPKDDFPRDYVYYCIQGDDFQGFIQNNIDSHSAQENISGTSIGRYPVLIPPLPEQRAIASVLSSLDYKIDLLHRQNKTLEAMAETLFRQWFVEEVDKNWEEKPLSEVAHFLNGLACQKYPPKNETDKLPVLKIKELGSGISETSDFASSKVPSEYIVESGDIIFSWSASLMVKIWDGEKCVLNQHLFKVTSSKYPKWYCLAWCKHHLAEFIAISASHATTMGHIKRGDLDSAIVTVPPDDVICTMSTQMVPIFDKQLNNAKQIHLLIKLRDTLLPKLMNGEVRVTL